MQRAHPPGDERLMLAGPSDALKQAVAELWTVPPPGPENLFYALPFEHLRSVCQADYPTAGAGSNPTFALGNAIRSLGVPCWMAPQARKLSMTADQAARELDVAFRRSHAKRIHLCPLDLADRLPALEFGACTLRRFRPEELALLVDDHRLRRWFPLGFDTARCAQFDWLVVEERVPLSVEPEARAVPVLFTNFRQDFGRIEPHKARYPAVVEDALFYLLLAPWETWTSYHEVDWRPFRIPWTYTVDNDLFVRPPAPPSPDSLTWEPDGFVDDDGEKIEFERPSHLPLDEAAAASLATQGQDVWDAVVRARASPLFETPVAHFLVRAFLSDDMDEVLAHMTMIEAALGVRADYGRRAKDDPFRKLGAKDRVAARIAGLLDSQTSAADFEHLFEVRSMFLHGRAMPSVTTTERVLTRRIARALVEQLIKLASSRTEEPRDVVLRRLLERGAAMVQGHAPAP